MTIGFIDYRDHPIDADLLATWAAELGWTRLVNRASMTWRHLPEASKNPQNDAEWLGLIETYPALVRRPVVVSGEDVDVGCSEKKFAERFEP